MKNEDESEMGQKMQNLFQNYSDSYYLVSINSPIIDEVVAFQNFVHSYNTYTKSMEKIRKVNSYYFMSQNITGAMRRFRAEL